MQIKGSDWGGIQVLISPERLFENITTHYPSNVLAVKSFNCDEKDIDLNR